jgi:ABC-type branched-subunit amino acid transport system substrate-binding protein
MTWAPENTDATNKPGMPALAGAYARWINSHGGLSGHKLKVLTCNDHNNAVDAAKCARQAVSENVVAVVGSYSQYSDSFLPPLAGAGIPYIGGYGVTNGEFTSPVSYPVNGGQPVLLAGLGKALAGSCGPVTLVRPDSIAGDELPQLLNAGLTAGGHKAAYDQLAAEDATEYSAQSDKALKQSTADSARKGCVVPVLGEHTATFMDSFRRTREDYPAVQTGTVMGSADQTEINETGGASSPYEGSYIASWYPAATDARWNEMKKVINEKAFGDNRIDPADAGVQTTWIAYQVFKAVVESLDGDISSNAIRRAIDNGLKISTGGLTPPLRWEFSNKLAGVGFPRLVNADISLQVVKDGQLAATQRDMIDVTKTLADAELD